MNRVQVEWLSRVEPKAAESKESGLIMSRVRWCKSESGGREAARSEAGKGDPLGAGWWRRKGDPDLGDTRVEWQHSREGPRMGITRMRRLPEYVRSRVVVRIETRVGYSGHWKEQGGGPGFNCAPQNQI
ncbi:hypothetical protein L6452_18567 [Arctium lappa]|uniref:Uncharacterized protein n=1 Tax=Arctium lappa TaxID=4217 RepID=A0ACB9C6M5_ARCLA|nr:hypothetical protein L6452_18567 [Arctium lappa]